MKTSQEFWDFSLAVYQQPGVAEECLDLQDRLGADVNLLLLCAFVGARRNASLDEGDIAAAIAVSTEWHMGVVRSLRAARKAIKPWTENAESAVAPEAMVLRSAVKKLELDAERIEHDLLAHWLNGRELRPAPATTAVPSNIRKLLRYYAPDEAAVPIPHRMVAAAIAQVV